MKKLDLSIIVPTYNSSANLELLFKSLIKSQNQNFEVIINDDRKTDDDTQKLIKSYSKKLSITYIQQNRLMSEARKIGSSHAKSPILLHLDSDMQVDSTLIGECAELVVNNSIALVIPEDSFGTTFWAKCKYLEKKMYESNDKIESLRCLSKSLYDELGGHDSNMVFSEDKDLDLRARMSGVKIIRTKSRLLHNEGRLKLIKTALKKAHYANTANIYAKKHPLEYRWQINPFNRYWIFLKNIKYLFIYPLLYIGVYIMKTVEYLFASIDILRTYKPSKHSNDKILTR